MSNNTGGAAFPHHIQYPNGHWPEVTHAGMTLRDYFAAKAMQADLDMADCIHEQEFALVAKRAYKIADAMLKAREASNGS